MLLQFLPKAPERARQADLHPGDAPEGTVAHTVEEDDAWVEGQSLIATVEDVELIDPDLSGERLLYRLFHERGVRVFSPLPLRAQCSCSRDAVSAMLNSFAPQQGQPKRGAQFGQGVTGSIFVAPIPDLPYQLLLDTLGWLGLEWDEGPEVGGPHAPYRQSQLPDAVPAER